MYEMSDFIEVARKSEEGWYRVDFDECYKNNSKKLTVWLNVDFWEIEEAVAILLDLEPESLIYADDGKLKQCKSFSGYFTIQKEYHLKIREEEILEELSSSICDYTKLFRSFSSGSPLEWVQRALDKKLAIPWYRWAVSQKLVDDEIKTSLEQANANHNEGTQRTSNKQIQSKKEKPLADRERKSLLRIIAALAQVTQDKKIILPFNSQSELISHVTALYTGYDGISKTSLEKHLANGKKLFD